MSTTLPQRTSPHDKLIEALKKDCDSIAIYHYRYVPKIGKYLDYKALEVLKDFLKEDYNQISDSLTHGMTVVLTRNGEDAIAAISVCSEKDNFEKNTGIKIALKRLLNYYHKKETASWDYKEEMFITFAGLPADSVEAVKEVTRCLSYYKPLLQRKIFVHHSENAPKVNVATY